MSSPMIGGANSHHSIPAPPWKLRVTYAVSGGAAGMNRRGNSMANSMRESSRGSKLDLTQPPLTLRFVRRAERPENAPPTKRIGTSTTTLLPHRCSIHAR